MELALTAARNATNLLATAAIGSAPATTRVQQAIPASPLRAIAAQAPVLVYQFLLRDDGRISFPYLSEGCHTLLGVECERLSADPALFLEMVEPRDRQSYLDSMAVSANEMKAWTWEGRVRIDSGEDIKWINLRATPRAMPGLGVQWEGLMTNITQSKLNETAMRQSRHELAELAAHTVVVREQERARLAREIHDELGGNLTAIKMAVARLAQCLQEDGAALTEKADYVDALVDRTIEAVHRISSDLRPVILDLGIVEAIRWQARESEKQLGISFEVESNCEEIELASEQATCVFRIVQEALTNIARHAKATKVTIRLSFKDNCLEMTIADNGKGLGTEDRAKSRFGIRGMAERAQALGGDASIESPEHGGCVVNIRILTGIPCKFSALKSVQH
jgi:two-component system sensor histidine kinase UhpB